MKGGFDTLEEDSHWTDCHSSIADVGPSISSKTRSSERAASTC